VVIEHFLTCHRETTFNSIALLSTSGRVFKYRCFLTLGRKMSECKSEQRVNIKFLVKWKKSETETFRLLTEAYGEKSSVEVSNISKTKKSTQELFEVQGRVDCFLRYPGYCNGRVGSQWHDGKSAVLH
jgi:hypothetical protein